MFIFKNSSREQSSTVPRHQQKTTINKKNDLLNILHDGLTKSSTTNDQCSSSSSRNHIAIQCSSNDLEENINSSDRILIGHLLSSSASASENSSPILIPPGYNQCGIQVDLNENNIDSLTSLIEFYSNNVSSDIVEHFYEVCNSDIQWTKTQIDEYLQNDHVRLTIPTLRQLSLKALNEWDQEIKHSNPLFGKISIEDLLQDINDENIIQTNTNTHTNQSIEFNNSNQILIPYTILNSLQELYGELPINSNVSDCLSLPLDDELSMNIYQALQRFLGVSDKIPEPVNEKKSTKETKKINKQQRQSMSPPLLQNQSSQKTNIPSLKQIMNEEAYCNNVQKSTEVLKIFNQ